MNAQLDTLKDELDKALKAAQKVVRRHGVVAPYLMIFTHGEGTWHMEPIPMGENGLDWSVEATAGLFKGLDGSCATVGAVCGVDLPTKDGGRTPAIYASLYHNGAVLAAHRLIQYQIIDELESDELEALRREYWRDFLEERHLGEDHVDPEVEWEFRNRYWPNVEPSLLVEFLEYWWDDAEQHLPALLAV